MGSGCMTGVGVEMVLLQVVSYVQAWYRRETSVPIRLKGLGLMLCPVHLLFFSENSSSYRSHFAFSLSHRLCILIWYSCCLRRQSASIMPPNTMPDI